MRRGNAEEDQVLIRLAHGLIARSQRPDPRLLQTETSSTTLPARLIDVGLDDTQSPRLVDTASQTGYYVALSYCLGSQASSEMRLTMSSLSRLQRNMEPSELPRRVSDAIELTRSLGVRYIWIDSLCVVQDDQEELLNAISSMSDIYRSAILTIAAVGANDETFYSCIDGPVLEQPFSILLDWSRPTIAKLFSDRLFTSNTFNRDLSITGARLSLLTLYHQSVSRRVRSRRRSRSKFYAKFDCTTGPPALDSDWLHDAEDVLPKVEAPDTQFDEASREIEQGVHHVEAGKSFEALALFMKARELVNAFRPLTPRSWEIHAVASANIALVYQMQHLPAMALDIAEASLAVRSRLPTVDCNSTLE